MLIVRSVVEMEMFYKIISHKDINNLKENANSSTCYYKADSYIFKKKKGSIYPHTIEKNTNIAFQFR